MPSTNLAQRLDRYLRLNALPIVGVSIGTEKDRTSWVIHWEEPPSEDLQMRLRALLATFNPNDPALIDDEKAHDASEAMRHPQVLALAMATWELVPNPTMTKQQFLDRAQAIYKSRL